MAKYYIKEHKRGIYYRHEVLPATGSKLKELISSGAKIFNERSSAVDYADNLKKSD